MYMYLYSSISQGRIHISIHLSLFPYDLYSRVVSSCTARRRRWPSITARPARCVGSTAASRVWLTSSALSTPVIPSGRTTSLLKSASVKGRNQKQKNHLLGPLLPPPNGMIPPPPVLPPSGREHRLCLTEPTSSA